MSGTFEKSQTFNYFEPSIYNQQLFLNFKKRKTEKSFLLDHYQQNFFLLKSLLLIHVFLSLCRFSPDPSNFIEFQGPSNESISLYLLIGGLFYFLKRFDKKYTVNSIYAIKFAFSLISTMNKIKIVQVYDYKSGLITVLLIDFSFLTILGSPFFFQFCLSIMGSSLLFCFCDIDFNSLISIIFFSNGFSLITEMNTRKAWIFLDQQRKGFRVFLYLYNNSINPNFVIDQNKRIISMNSKAQEIYDFAMDASPQAPKNAKAAIKKKLFKSHFTKLLKPSLQETFEDQLIRAQEYVGSAFILDIALPKKYSGREQKYTESETNLLEDILQKESLFEEFSDENVNNSEQPTARTGNRSPYGNIFIDLNGSQGGQTIVKRDNMAMEMMFNANIKPILWASKPCFLIEFKDILSEKNVLKRALCGFDEIHQKSLEILAILENDYVKWNNLQSNAQGASLIKDGDLKNLANGIYLMNMMLNKVCRKKELISFFLEQNLNEKKKFHVPNTLIYLLEIVLLKTTEKNCEVNLTFEDSFPDFVFGEYFRFKTTVLVLLKIIFVYTNFPKFSKFKIHCKLKEIITLLEERKYVLGFDFEMPRNENQIKLFDLLLTHPFFNEISNIKQLFYHPTMCQNDTRQEFLMFRVLLEVLGCKFFYNDQDSNRYKVCLEIQFNIVAELDTLLGSKSSRDEQNISGNNLGYIYSGSRGTINHKLMNLTFLRSVVKKNHFSWKPKPKKVDKIHAAPSLNQIKSVSKEFKRENSNNSNVNTAPSNVNIPIIDVKKIEERQSSLDHITEENQAKLKSALPNSLSKSISEEAPIGSRKSLKRKDSQKYNLLFSKTSSAVRNELPFEEIKGEYSEEGYLEHRKSHFSIMQAPDEIYDSPKINRNVSRTSTHKFTPSIMKHSRSKEDLFPPDLKPRLDELKDENSRFLKKMFMKDTLILLKHHVINQEKRRNKVIFKSEAFITMPKENESIVDPKQRKKLQKDMKFNTISSINDLSNFDYRAYRKFVSKNFPNQDFPSFIQLDSLKNIEEDGIFPLSKEAKKFFSSLFSINQQKSFRLLEKNGKFNNEALKKMSFSFFRPSLPNFDKINDFLNKFKKDRDTKPKEDLDVLLLPYLKVMPRNEIPPFLLTRLETRLSGWNQAGMRTQSMGLLRMKKIKKHNKFSILINDDNINDLQIFQKFLNYNSSFQVHYGQSFTVSLEIFRGFMENGFNYDLIFIDLKGKTMNGYELMKNVRGIEKLTNSITSYIVGILEGVEQEPTSIDERGIDKFIFRPITEKMIQDIILSLNQKASF